MSSCSQILLKKSANIQYKSIIREYLNLRVISAYIMFFSATIFSTIAFKVIPLSLGPVLESTGYVYVSILSYIFLKEKLSIRKLLGIGTIVLGIIIFTLL